MNTKIKCILLLAVLLSFQSLIASSVPYGNKLSTFFWTQKEENDSLKYGCYAYSHVTGIDSSDVSQLKYSSNFWLNYSWWKLLFGKTFVKIDILNSKSKPSSITQSPNHFDSIEWITGFTDNITKDTIQFYFPLLPVGMSYGRYDYFTVSINDTVELQVYGAGDSIMVGTFLLKNGDSEGRIVLLGRNAIIIELTNSNVFRIKSVRFDAKYKDMINEYLKFDLNRFKSDEAWYGVDIIDGMPLSFKCQYIKIKQ
jgi:hypothetical protein